MEEQSLMIGRGLLKNPWLVQELSTQLLGGSDGTDACGGDIMREGFPKTDITEANNIQRSDAWKANVQKTVGQKGVSQKWDYIAGLFAGAFGAVLSDHVRGGQYAF